MAQFIETKLIEAALAEDEAEVTRLVGELNQMEREGLAKAMRAVTRELLNAVMPNPLIPR